MRIISIIKSYFPNLSKQEKKVADYVIGNIDNISIMSLTEITKKIGVSEATIVRFVRKVGYKGFIDFKLEVAKEYAIEKEEKETKENYIEKIEDNIISTIKSTKKILNKEKVEEAIELILNSKEMFIYGLGASGVAAVEMQNRFLRFGKLSHSINDGHFQVMYSSVIKKEDLLIVISLSGETSELIYSLKLAKKRGVKIIAITNYIMSPIAKEADVVLLTSARETPLDGGSLISKISQLYIIDILATGYAVRNNKISKKVKEDIAKAIASKNK